jgi:carboxylesterase
MIPTIMKGAEPRFHAGNGVGCLCIHGFMASPNEVQWLGDYLAGCGYTTCLPRIAGHGLDPTQMITVRWQDYYASVLDGYHLLRQHCDQVFVMGLSMGGLLSLLLASQEKVDGVAALASPVKFDRMTTFKMRHANKVRYLLPWTNHPTDPDLLQKIESEQRRRREPIVGRVRYERWHTAAIYQLYLLAQTVNDSLPRVTAPLLLIYSKADDTASYDNMRLIANRVGSQHIQTHTLQHSDHILTQDTDRDRVFEWANEFIQPLIQF